jgi:hypothetical protein
MEQDTAREVLRELLAESESVLTAAALDASASATARAHRLALSAEPLLQTPGPDEPPHSRTLRIEGLLREIDACFPKDALPEPLPAVRERLRGLLAPAISAS